jgi:hypothetical protein
VQLAWASVNSVSCGTAKEGTQGVIPFPPYGEQAQRNLILATLSTGLSAKLAAIPLILCQELPR